MTLNVVENVNGRARIVWPGAVVLFLGLLLACVAVPAAGFWVVLGDAKLTGTAAAAGFSIACAHSRCCSFSSCGCPSTGCHLAPNRSHG